MIMAAKEVNKVETLPLSNDSIVKWFNEMTINILENIVEYAILQYTQFFLLNSSWTQLRS